jgi:hypothetical protein
MTASWSGLTKTWLGNASQIVVNVNGIQKSVDPGSQATIVALNRFVALGEDGVLLSPDSVVISGSLGANQASGGPYPADSVETTIGKNVQLQSQDSWLLGDSVVVDAGSYGSLQAGKGATVILTGGQYDFSAWDIGDNANIVVQAPVEIRIAGQLNVGSDVNLSPDPTSGLTASAVHFFVTGQNGDTGDLGATPAAAAFGNNDILAASIFVPNGTLNIGKDTQASGAFLGKWVTIGNNTTLTLDSGW